MGFNDTHLTFVVGFLCYFNSSAAASFHEDTIFNKKKKKILKKIISSGHFNLKCQLLNIIWVQPYFS